MNLHVRAHQRHNITIYRTQNSDPAFRRNCHPSSRIRFILPILAVPLRKPVLHREKLDRATEKGD